ncbi:MAG: TetR/AcrR family transcriptional regulator [Promethearchaeota archaeon]
MAGAILVFVKKGDHTVKITDIENELGVSKGTSYQWLKSKKDLFQAVIQMPLKRFWFSQPFTPLIEYTLGWLLLTSESQSKPRMQNSFHLVQVVYPQGS